jgi:hypothetical protein
MIRQSMPSGIDPGRQRFAITRSKPSRALAFAQQGAVPVPFNKIATIGIFCQLLPRKSSLNRQKLQMRRDNDRFPPKSRCRLSYQACPIPRIVLPSGMAGLRGPAVR